MFAFVATTTLFGCSMEEGQAGARSGKDWIGKNNLHGETIMNEHHVVNLRNGDVFECDTGSIMVKLRNPETKPLENVNDKKVWAADVGNGQISKLDPHETVTRKGQLWDLLKEEAKRG